MKNKTIKTKCEIPILRKDYVLEILNERLKMYKDFIGKVGLSEYGLGLTDAYRQMIDLIEEIGEIGK